MKYFGIIYLAINKINNKIYIGQTTKSLNVRKTSHRHAALRNKTNNKFHNAIRNYNWNNFEWHILDFANNIDELNVLEIFYIDKFQSYYCGYNSTFGGKQELGKKMPREFVERHRLRMTGRKASLETKMLQSKNNSKTFLGKKGREHPKFGKKMPDSAKKAISLANSGTNHPLYGKKAKPEAILKRVAKLKKPIKCIETGQIFDSIKDCITQTGAQRSSLSRHLHHHPNYKSVLGKHYEFLK